jgi:hypothetical protein
MIFFCHNKSASITGHQLINKQGDDLKCMKNCPITSIWGVFACEPKVCVVHSIPVFFGGNRVKSPLCIHDIHYIFSHKKHYFSIIHTLQTPPLDLTYSDGTLLDGNMLTEIIHSRVSRDMFESFWCKTKIKRKAS